MIELSNRVSDIKSELLNSINDFVEVEPTFDACLDAHGKYETMRFVLRLSPRNHELMDQIEQKAFDHIGVPPEAVQAYSTYMHETVHWWQHVGSTSGLLLSLSYLAQSHSNLEELRNILSKFGPKKPLKGYADQILLKEGVSAQGKLAAINTVVNNALDVEYYKSFALSPRENIKWMIKENHFEAVGHSYLVVYSQIAGMLASIIDPTHFALPSLEKLDVESVRLNTERVEGFYWGSPVRLPAVGLKAIYEGQARFVQLQFLDGALDERLRVSEWRDKGYISGVYGEAFEAFLKLSNSDWPEFLDGPLVALFLLICDVSINPTRGIPLEIEKFEDLISDVDVGVRFTRLSQAVKKIPQIRHAIINYSREEYIGVSEELTALAGYDHPMAGLRAIRDWLDNAPGLPKLMEEFRTFNYDPINVPIRVFISHFVSFNKDKFERPEFFCWPGIFMSRQRKMDNPEEVWLRHLSLFSDRGEKDGVYPRKWPERDKKAIQETFNRFYGSMALYDLTRQWLLRDGPFKCDFRWLSDEYNQTDADNWGNITFESVYGIRLDAFEIVQ